MLRKVTIIQCPVGRQLDMEDNLFIFKQKPDFVVLPEYYNVDPDERNTALNASWAGEYLEYCRTLSDRLQTILIAGTAVELDANNFYNTSFVYSKGFPVGAFRKLNPTNNEGKYGIRPGQEYAMVEIGGVRISVLICADVLHSHNFGKVAETKPDIIFVPTTSPLKPFETVSDKFERDRKIFINGARTSGSYIIKCCAVGQLWGGRLQGRSLAAAPWGILTRIAPDDEDRKRILSVILDIEELRDFRRKRSKVSENNSF